MSPSISQRPAKMPNGEEITVGFSLAFVSDPRRPGSASSPASIFAPIITSRRAISRMRTPRRRARGVDLRRWRTGACRFHGQAHRARGQDGSRSGCVVSRPAPAISYSLSRRSLSRPSAKQPPHPEDGPHLAGLTIGCRALESFGDRGLRQIGDSYVLPASRNFGTALRFHPRAEPQITRIAASSAPRAATPSQARF